MSLGFVNCRVVVTNLDCQPSLNGNILVQVIGQMSNSGESAKSFVQTFVLAEQPTGYYLHNDIFRFLKEDSEVESTDFEPVHETSAVSDVEKSVESQVVAEKESESEPEPVAVMESSVPVSLIKVESFEAVTLQSSGSSETTEAKNDASEPSKKSWANMAANNRDKWGAQVADVKGTVATAPVTRQPSAPNMAARKSTDSGRKEPKRVVVNEDYSLFLHGLPANVNYSQIKQEIERALAKEGGLTNIYVNKGSAHLTFSNVDVYNAVLLQKNFVLEGNLQVTVDAQRPPLFNSGSERGADRRRSAESRRREEDAAHADRARGSGTVRGASKPSARRLATESRPPSGASGEK